MTKLSFSMIGLSVILASGIALAWFDGSRKQAFAEDVPKPESASKFAPVGNLQHLMEYINEPIFQSLSSALQNQPRDEETWAEVKSAALILSETSGLVAKRGKTVTDEDWQSSSLLVHTEGTKLYLAAHKKDYDSAKKYLKSMRGGCSKCHESFR